MAPLDELRRWYFVDEAIHITARAECPPYTPPMQLLGDESQHTYGPEPQHLRKLRAAAKAGRVALLDDALAPLSFLGDSEIGDAVIEREELRRFALAELGIWLHRPMFADKNAKRRARGYFSLFEIAVAVAEQLRWHEQDQEHFLAEITAAAESTELPTYDEYTQLRFRPGTVNRFGAFAKRDEVDAWLEQRGATYRPEWDALLQSDRLTVESVNVLSRLLPESYHTNFRVPENAFTSGMTEQVAAEPAPEADAAAPLPLTTGDVSFCFDGLRDWDEPRWKKALGNKPKWLAACVAIPGRQGVCETRWNPVLIGAALVRAGHAQARFVRARFQSRPMLKPWLDAWKTYEADHIDSA